MQSSGKWATGDSGNHCCSTSFPDSLSKWDLGVAGKRRPCILTRDKVGAVSTVDRTEAAIRIPGQGRSSNRIKHLTTVSLQLKQTGQPPISRWVYSHSVEAAAAAKSLQSCTTLCNPKEAAHQAPLSLGFSRQEHWSVLPFPSPMHESEK